MEKHRLAFFFLQSRPAGQDRNWPQGAADSSWCRFILLSTCSSCLPSVFLRGSCDWDKHDLIVPAQPEPRKDRPCRSHSPPGLLHLLLLQLLQGGSRGGGCVYDEESKCGQRANSRLCLYLPQVTPGAKTDSGCTVSPSVSAPVGASVHWAVSFCVHGQGETQGMNSRWDARQAFLREGAVCRGAPDHLLPWHSDPPKFAAQPTKFTDLPALKVSIRVGSL